MIGALLGGIASAPLAPVRAVLWLAETLAAQAALQSQGSTTMRDRLIDVEAALAAGDLTEAEAVRLEEELLSQLLGVSLEPGESQ